MTIKRCAVKQYRGKPLLSTNGSVTVIHKNIHAMWSKCPTYYYLSNYSVRNEPILVSISTHYTGQEVDQRKLGKRLWKKDCQARGLKREDAMD